MSHTVSAMKLRLLPILLSTLVLVLQLGTSMPAHADAADDVQRLIAQGNLPGALQRAEAAAKGADARLRFLHGVLMDMQRDALALQMFTALTQDYPQLPEPYNNIAAIHSRAGRWDLARTALETALRNDPSHLLVRENLGDAYHQLALASWQSAARPDRPDPILQRKIRVAVELIARSVRDGRGSSDVATPPSPR
jgi:tetratricopeptide (TPR) repeat protein